VKISKKKNENFVCKWTIENAMLPKMLFGLLEVNMKDMDMDTSYISIQSKFLTSSPMFFNQAKS